MRSFRRAASCTLCLPPTSPTPRALSSASSCPTRSLPQCPGPNPWMGGAARSISRCVLLLCGVTTCAGDSNAHEDSRSCCSFSSEYIVPFVRGAFCAPYRC